ncbi:MAG: bifunctional UDP-N-acetylglucosamine diphosphorylase/glucosamine-1-phosphate N-acetyltransferase GlmU, partial [Pseudomonadota bacterium]|nr:bifunctional UDP-N-acetylglucosamine diphosphorylase/glucosamine-1-phosphate N-acetyltransferase GlmU [Pseudomonadota bacterium]
MSTAVISNIVILAAGKGTRMVSAQPKVMQKLAGQPMLAHVLQTAVLLQPAKIIVVYGYGAEQVSSFLVNQDVVLVHQKELLGTGHALLQALPYIDHHAKVLIMYGDVPLLHPDTLKALMHKVDRNNLSLLTQQIVNPLGYGRVVRDRYGAVKRIVEEKDATESEKKIDEINTGVMCILAEQLGDLLPKINNLNAQKEYYLTDLIDLAAREGILINTFISTDMDETLGINNRTHLAMAEKILRKRAAERLLNQGVCVVDPDRIDVRGQLDCGTDVEIDIGCIFEGNVKIGDNVKVGAYSILRDVILGNNVQILPYTLMESAIAGNDSRIGPYARIRPGTQLGSGVHVGDFVEIKNAIIGNESKINHMSYVGDSEVGERVNIGAGTITCNFDGENKHRTIIGDNVFIG